MDEHTPHEAEVVTPIQTPPNNNQPLHNAPPSDTHWSLDPRTIEFMKWGAIWNAVAGAIDAIVSWIASAWLVGRVYGSYTASSFGFGGVISNVIWAAIYGAIGGFILAKYYPFFMSLQKKYLKNTLNTLFKLLFWPTVVGAFVSLLIASPFALAVGFNGILLSIVGSVLARFVFAKGMERSVGSKLK